VRLGLTGGIGAGKSTVSAHLAGRGAYIIDYDLLAREAVAAGTPGLAAIVERFGAGILLPDGTLDRPALGAIVFGDDSARLDLEAITHPAIGRLAWSRDETAPPNAVIVHDHPLLIEVGLDQMVDLVVVVDVPEDVQVDRLVELRGMSEADARARIAAQSDRERRLAAADVVIDNAGSPDDLVAAVDRLWASVTA
jgi:dephospho-CoA kinase